jgi:hypothetical protein
MFVMMTEVMIAIRIVLVYGVVVLLKMPVEYVVEQLQRSQTVVQVVLLLVKI